MIQELLEFFRFTGVEMRSIPIPCLGYFNSHSENRRQKQKEKIKMWEVGLKSEEWEEMV
jgi:hypothetical protein